MKLQAHAIAFLFLFTIPWCKAQTDAEKMATLTLDVHQRFQDALYDDPDQAKMLLDSLQVLAETTTLPQAKFYATYGLACQARIRHDMIDSKKLFETANGIARDNDLKKEQVEATTWLANLAYFNSNNSRADSLYREVINLSKTIDHVDGIAGGFFGLASTEVDDSKSLVFLLKIDSLYKKHDKVSAILANSYDVIGRMYLNSFNDKQLARSYFRKALETSKKVNYVPGILYAGRLSGGLALDDGDFEEARTLFTDLYDKSIQLEDSIETALSLLDLARVDRALGKNIEARRKLNDALSIYMRANDSVSITNTHLQLARIALSLDEFDNAQKHLDSTALYFKTLDSLKYAISRSSITLSLLEAQGHYKEALVMNKLLDSLKTEQLTRKNSQEFLKIEQRYRASEKEKEVNLLKTEKALSEQQKKNQRNLFILGLIVLVLGLFSLFFLYRNKLKTNAKLREIDRLKSNFFANISHEFRTPLTLIAGPINKKLEAPELTNEDRADFNMVLQNKDRLLRLVDQVLDLSKVDAGSLHVSLEKASIFPFISALAEAFDYPSNQKGLSFTKDIPVLDDEVWFDKDTLAKIMNNLLSNAIKYTSKGEKIHLSTSLLSEKTLHLTVRNTAPEVKTSSLDAIFDRFHRLHHDMEGSGIGLALTKELVALHKGKIRATKEGDELIFLITLCVDKEQFDEQHIKTSIKEVASPLINHEITAVNASTEEGTFSEEMPILLIIEDHPDLRNMIATNFKDDFTVLTAANGKIGFEAAIEKIPDVIISDVMMPEMDGVSMTKKLKNDERTSHIPIILLTAKAGEENELFGIDAGADDYMTKPFNANILKAKTNRLIATRQQLQSRYSQEVVLKPKDISLTSADESFLNKVQSVLDDHLVEPTFNVEQFSLQVGLSRMQLLRKMKALTGKTPTEFLKMERLKLAANLLKDAKTPIAQVGYAVGFNDHSYFTKCFRENYGITPSDYAKQR